jgi:hypothetical protein
MLLSVRPALASVEFDCFLEREETIEAKARELQKRSQSRAFVSSFSTPSHQLYITQTDDSFSSAGLLLPILQKKAFPNSSICCLMKNGLRY